LSRISAAALFTAAALPPAVVFAQDVPAWYPNPGMDYPEDRFITGIGSGATESAACNAAVGNIARFFETTASVRTDVLERYSEASNDGKTAAWDSIQIEESVSLSSEADLLGVSLAPVFHQSSGPYYALAYIDKAAVLGVYDARIRLNVSKMERILEDSGGDPISVLARLRQAEDMYTLTDGYIKMTATISPAAAAEYAALAGFKKTISDSLAVQRTRLTARVEGLSTHERVARKLSAVLQKQNFIITKDEPSYIVSFTVDETEEYSGRYIGLRAGFEVLMKRTADGEAVFSYTPASPIPLQKHLRFDGARSQVHQAIEKDLDENFIREFNAALRY
jgi:hypothetical protein